MGNKNAPKTKSSNVSSVANPAVSAATSTGSKSSILKSSFAPSHFQLSLFASVIQGLDSQHLRIHDTITGRLRCEHSIASKASVTCLDWGLVGRDPRNGRQLESPKKRKRTEQVNGDAAGPVVLGFGTSDSEIHIFSPLEAKVVGILKDGHTQGIRDFKFVETGPHGDAWSAGGDGRVVNWDLKTKQALRSVPLPHGPASAICALESSVICASHSAYIVHAESKTPPITFPASMNLVHTILRQPSKSPSHTAFLTAAEADHFITIFDGESPTSLGSLRTDNEVLSVDLYSRPEKSSQREKLSGSSHQMFRPHEAISIVNKNGVLEIFPEPFDFSSAVSQSGSESKKARMMQRTRKAAAQVRITRPDKGSTAVPLIKASFQGSHIALAWTEGGINLCFDMLPWRDEKTGDLLLQGNTNIVKAKSGTGLSAVVMNGVKDMGKSHVDESNTVVANGGGDDVHMHDGPQEVIDISSGEEESEYEEDNEAELKLDDGENTVAGRTEERQEEMDMDGASGPETKALVPAESEETEEPSFGDLIRANAPEAIDVQASFVDSNAQSLVPTGGSGLQQLPSGMSLGTVLTQSLRTNDRNLLETCFHVQDLPTIRATIERLDSSFASTLLQRLAERLHSKPGRAGSLMVWIQWTLVAHGGYLAGQPEVMRKLASLHRVVKDRANSLQSLLALKGKLDMLEAQMNIRKSMQARAKEEDDDEDEGVIYVEGQEDSDSEGDEDEEDKDNAGVTSPKTKLAKKSKKAQELEVVDDADSGNDMTTTNGALASSEDEGNESDEGMFDEEASSTDQDSDDEMLEGEVDHDSVDSESSDGETSPPPKRPAKMAKLTNGH